MTAYPKPVRVKSESYRRFVAQQACMGCGIEGYSQACHPNGAGMGTKADDTLCFPLCCTRPGIIGCHAQLDQCHGMTLDDRKELEGMFVARMQEIARQAGRRELK